MKGKLFKTLCFSILSTIVLLTSLVLVNPASAQAATPPTDANTSLDLNQTIDQAFPNWQTDKNEAIVRDALLKADYPEQYAGQIKSTSTLEDVQKCVPRVIITEPMKDYAPLIKVVNLAHSLCLANQSQLSEDNLYAIAQSFMINHADIDSLEFPNDDLTDTDLEMLIDLAKEYTPNQQSNYLNLLDLSRNKISNFTSWLAFKNSDDKNAISSFNAPMQDSETTTILPAQNLTGTSIKIPFTDLPELTTNFSDFYYKDYTLVRASLTSNEDFFDTTDHFDNQDRILTKLVPDQLPRGDTSLPIINDSLDTDYSDMYTIGLSPDTYTPTLSMSAFHDKLLDYGMHEYTSPTDTTHLTINNIPAGSHQLTLKIARLVRLDSPQMWTTYVQNYTIPLKSPTTSNTATSVESSESTTVDTPNQVADQAKPESKIVYATKKIGLYKSPTTN